MSSQKQYNLHSLKNKVIWHNEAVDNGLLLFTFSKKCVNAILPKNTYNENEQIPNTNIAVTAISLAQNSN